MVGRRREPTRFRPSAGARVGSGLSPAQNIALLSVLALAVAGVAIASIVVKPSKSRAFQLVSGSVFLNDNRAPVAVDLASGQPTVRMVAGYTQVDATGTSGLTVVPLTGATLLLNNATGEFNMVDNTGFVIKNKNGGVPLPKTAGTAEKVGTLGVAAGASAYIVRAGTSQTSVYLVNQNTVQAAASGDSHVKARAYATLGGTATATAATPAAATAASANGELWLLTGTGADRTIDELNLPNGSDDGVQLSRTSHGTVDAGAAVGVATRNADGTGGDVVGVATATSVRIFDPGGPKGGRTLAIHGLTGVNEILPATNDQGAVQFLYRSDAGWSTVSVDVATTTGGLRGPLRLTAIGARASLAQPAASDGRLYTVDTRSGALWQIAGSHAVHIAGAEQYPTSKKSDGKPLEKADFTGVTAFARNDRVIFNSRNLLLALTVFTDGSHPPSVIDKNTAVDLNAAGGAAALTNPHIPKTPPTQTSAPTPVTPPAEQVNNKAGCKDTAQIPNVPTITAATPGSRSVLLAWNYPLPTPQDCEPTTYTVTVKALDANAPSAPAQLTVYNQTGVNLVGLFPSTRYEIVLTAFLGGQGTASAPVDITTGPEGPAAPTNVHTVVNANGQWTISWNSCGGGAKANCVEAASWNVIAAFCDGVGLATPPTLPPVLGDPTTGSFSTTLTADSSTLGRGLTFQVEGVGDQGTAGTTANDGSCSYSWKNPNPAAMALTASVPGDTGGAASVPATLTLSFNGDPTEALGGAGAQLTYEVLQGGSVVWQTEVPSTQTSVTSAPVVAPGRVYTSAVIVSRPARDPAASATVSTGAITTRSDWPANLSASATMTGNTLTVAIGNLSSAQAGGELFDATVTATCGNGNSSFNFTQAAIDPATAMSFPIDVAHQAAYFGACEVSVQLVEDPGHLTNPPWFGGTPAHPLDAGQITIAPPAYDPSLQTFAGVWNTDPANPTLTIAYTGGDPYFMSPGASQFTVSISDGTQICGTATSISAPIAINPTCLTDPNQAWSISIGFSYFGTPEAPIITTNINNSPPQPPAPADPNPPVEPPPPGGN